MSQESTELMAASASAKSTVIDSPEAKLQAQFTFFRTEMVASVREIAKVGERGASNLLLGLGAAIIISAMFWKLAPFGIKVSNLAASEFITVILVGFMLLVGGAVLRVYQFKVEMSLSGRVQEAGVELIRTTITTGAELAQKGSARKTNL